MIARILLRNSTDRQAKAGTVRAQRAPVRALAQRLGATQIVEYVEEGMSGAAPLDERDVLRRLLAEAQPGDLVCAYDMSRLTRSDDWIERYTVLGHLRRARLRPATIDDGEIDLQTIGGRITTHVRGEIAADERAKIRSRLDDGKVNAAELGRKPQGATPFGLTYDLPRPRGGGKGWGLDETEAPIMRDLFRRLLAGETTGRIAEAFTAAGHLTPRGRSTTWTARMIWQLATRPTYRGEWLFDGHTIAVPAIVDSATWHAAQAQLLAAGKRGLRRTQHVYLLDDGSGRCDVCTGPLHVRWSSPGGRSVSYYLCPRRACALRWRRTEAADLEVWERITAAMRRPDLVERALGRLPAVGAGGQLEATDAAGFEAQLVRLGDVEAALLRQFSRGRITEAALERELATLTRERDLLTRSAQTAREAAARAQAGAVSLERVREAVTRLGEGMASAGPEARRDLVRRLRSDVRVADDRIAVSFRLRIPKLAGREAPVVAIAVAGGTCSCTISHCETEQGDGADDGALDLAVVA